MTKSHRIIIIFAIISACKNKDAMIVVFRGKSIRASIADMWQPHRRKSSVSIFSHISARTIVSVLKICGRRRDVASYRPCSRRYRRQLNHILILRVARGRSSREMPGVKSRLSRPPPYTDSIQKPLELAKQPHCAQLDKLTSMCMRDGTHRDRSWWRI